MKDIIEFFINNDKVIFSIISLIFGSGLINGLVSYWLYNGKLKKELISSGNNDIAIDIQKSLKFVRDTELSLKEHDIFDMQSILKAKGTSIKLIEGNETNYISILNSMDSLRAFQYLIEVCRKEHEKNLPLKIGMNLWYIERYLIKLIIFLDCHGGEQFIKFWGTVFIIDFSNWQFKMDKMLVDVINKHNYKLESRDIKKWNKLKRKEIYKQYKNSILYCLCEKNLDNKQKETRDLIMKIYNDNLKILK